MERLRAISVRVLTDQDQVWVEFADGPVSLPAAVSRIAGLATTPSGVRVETRIGDRMIVEVLHRPLGSPPLPPPPLPSRVDGGIDGGSME